MTMVQKAIYAYEYLGCSTTTGSLLTNQKNNFTRQKVLPLASRVHGGPICRKTHARGVFGAWGSNM
jgi:hypothetical protein